MQLLQTLKASEYTFDTDLDEASKLPEEPSNHPALHQWQRYNLNDAVDNGSLADLILCLCSSHDEIRRQALMNLRLFASRLQGSHRRESEQTYVLVGELTETAEHTNSTEPLPSFAVALAAQAVRILNSPLHAMFVKVNMFLNRGPRWDVSRLPSYWVDRILHQPPSVLDRQVEECEWLLQVLMEGLRTPLVICEIHPTMSLGLMSRQDADLYRRCGIFERIMSQSSAQRLEPSFTEKSIRLLYRCTYVEGSTMLVTRCGVLAWIWEREAQDPSLGPLLRCLATRILHSCDTERLRNWSGSDQVQVASLLM